jgi:hypothetical protein
MGAIDRSGDAKLLSRSGLGWAGLAALVACAACCALPMVAVFGGGLLTSVAAFVSPGMELLVATAAGGGTLLFLAWRARARASTCSDTCRADASCCAPEASSTERS